MSDKVVVVYDIVTYEVRRVLIDVNLPPKLENDEKYVVIPKWVYQTTPLADIPQLPKR